ncbi:hypothetical protein BD779DRAFT_1455304 [Infundibulicybe gibba]|nr:hypothetical protein BD779DRAFT_1455304 [Infundibulicybe gibba]
MVEDRVFVVVDNHLQTYSLRGIIYHGHEHFTARIITTNGVVWHYDGIRDESPVVWEASTTALLDMYQRESQTTILAIYAGN